MPYNLIFTTKFNDSSILITIILWDYLNLSLADEHVGDVTIPTQVIEYNQNVLKRISQSDWNIQIKLNYIQITLIKDEDTTKYTKEKTKYHHWLLEQHTRLIIGSSNNIPAWCIRIISILVCYIYFLLWIFFMFVF